METRIAGPASRGPDRSGAIIGGAWGLAALVLSLTLVACGDGASPDTIEASGRPASAGTGLLTPSGGIPRYVLAVIDSSEGRTSTSNEVHRLAEFALQHLGYGVHYLDVDTQPLPPLDEMSPYAAVLTWFQDPRMRRPMEFIDWVEANVAAGRKYVLLGSAGVFRDSTTGRPLPTREPARLFKLLGAEFRGNFTDDSESIEVASAISELVEYERKLDPGLLTYQQVVSVDPENEVWLTVNRSDLTDGLSDVVFVGPAGGYAQEGYIFWEDLDSFRRHLRLDMFTFMRRALGRADWPAPDVTTLNGGRVLYSQIDGDGFQSRYESDPKSIAAEKIIDDVLRVYPYLVTASIIVFDIDPSESGSPRMERVARELFSLDNVELASHSWAHPFDWRGSLNADKNFAAETFPGYPNRELLVDREVRQSVEFINQRLAPPGKSVKVFLWSGQANPDPRALQATGEAGVVNMNGGLGRFDSEFDSSSWLVPLVAQVDGQVQYYATNPNDHNYTGLWTGPFEGFKNVIQTFKRTESPRRLTPIDVYYHFYSGSKDASLSALHQVFDWIGTQEITSVWASDYVRMVQGWLATAIHPLKQDVWRISDYGDMRTVRFDDTDATVDIVESTNVVGHRRINGSLYVFLGAGGEATVHLADSESQSPHLEYCGCLVDQRTVVGDADVFSVDARLDTVFRFAGLTPGTGLTFTISGASTSVTADADGKASVRLPRGSDTVEVRGHIDQR